MSAEMRGMLRYSGVPQTGHPFSCFSSLGGRAFIRDPGIRHIRLLHAATALPYRAGLSCAVREHLHRIRAHLMGLILHVVSSTGLKISIAREAAGKKVTLVTGHFTQVFTTLRFIRYDPHLLST